MVDHSTDRRTQELALLDRCVAAWGRQVIHLWDRGFAGARWQKGHQLLDRDGEERKDWEIARGKRSWGYRYVSDQRRREDRKVGVVAMSVTHPAHAHPLWLVVARPGHGREPWYLLTSDPITTEAAVWQVVFAYARRWQIEQTWRSWRWRVRGCGPGGDGCGSCCWPRWRMPFAVAAGCGTHRSAPMAAVPVVSPYGHPQPDGRPAVLSGAHRAQSRVAGL